MLVGFVARQGLLRHCSDVELAYAAKDAYRAYRGSFNRTKGLVTPLRKLRDLFIRGYRHLAGQVAYGDILHRTGAAVSQASDTMTRDDVAAIRFVGVWDTVAAYGTPVAELTRGIDDWVWPLSMPDYKLSPKVTTARHALALDDERDTFHPLLWDEVNEHKLVEAGCVLPDRLRQVWFSGMHANVGGGYPDDSAVLSLSALDDARERVALSPGCPGAGRTTAERVRSAVMQRRGEGGYDRSHRRMLSARMPGRSHDPF